jgi:hypothetical protein
MGPGQFVAFAKHVDSGASCDADGQPFAAAADATCVVFDSLDEACRFCDERVRAVPSIGFEVFDSAGRLNPPLLVIVNPARQHVLAGNVRAQRIRKYAAVVLALGALPLFWFDYATDRGVLVLPTIIGINMLVAAARLMQINSGVKESERVRKERLARATENRS